MLSSKTDRSPEAFQGEWMIPLGESEPWATQRPRIFQSVLLPLGLCVILFLFYFDFWFLKWYRCVPPWMKGERLLRAMSWHPWGRRQALVWDSKHWSVSVSPWTPTPLGSEGGEKGFRIPTSGDSAHCLSLPQPCFYLPGQAESENIINYADCFFPPLFKVYWWTSQGTGLDKLRPRMLINLKASTLGSQVNVFPLGLLGLAEP